MSIQELSIHDNFDSDHFKIIMCPQCVRLMNYNTKSDTLRRVWCLMLVGHGYGSRCVCASWHICGAFKNIKEV